MSRTVDRRRFIAELSATTVFLGFPALGCQKKVEDVRDVAAVIPAQPSHDGAGVKLRRALGHRGLAMLDPFLLLDEIRSADPADFARGFPTHPHRGFETVSYLISGRFEHADSVGNAGTIGAGDVQWMTAGKGIVHSEMPRAEAGEELWGLQLWVNLPRAQKWTPPRYQEVSKASIPQFDVGAATVRLVTGRVGDKQGPVDGIAVGPTMLDVKLEPGATFRNSVPTSDNAFAFVLEGEAMFGPRAVVGARGETVVLGTGSEIASKSAKGGRFLLFSGAPIGEPVARGGPFVMNTEEEIRQAWADYRSGRLVGG